MLVEVDLLDLQGIEVLAPQPVGAAQEHTALGVRAPLVLVRSPTQGPGSPTTSPPAPPPPPPPPPPGRRRAGAPRARRPRPPRTRPLPNSGVGVPPPVPVGTRHARK